MNDDGTCSTLNIYEKKLIASNNAFLDLYRTLLNIEYVYKHINFSLKKYISECN